MNKKSRICRESKFKFAPRRSTKTDRITLSTFDKKLENPRENPKNKRVYYKIRIIHLHYVRNERGTSSVKYFCWGTQRRNPIVEIITIDLRCSHCCIHHSDIWSILKHFGFVDIILLGTSMLVPLVYGYLVLSFKLNRQSVSLRKRAVSV